MENDILIMAEIVKLSDNTVAEIGTQEVRRVYGSTELQKRQENLEAELVKVKALRAALV